MESLEILRNLGPSIGNPYGTGAVCPGDGLFGKSIRSSTSAAAAAGGGFTLLQGHIQLMAMVPSLPENQVSPRWKPASDLSIANQSVSQNLLEVEKEAKYPNDPGLQSLPITPRMMPSASKYQRPDLSSVLAEKLEHKKRHTIDVHAHGSKSRTPSNSSLPPKHPVTMPSFAKQIPVSRRGVPKSPPSIFPPISNQPSQHRMSHPMQGQPPPLTKPSYPSQVPPVNLKPGSFMNQYTSTSATWLPPQMAYQFMNQLMPHQLPPQQVPPNSFYGPNMNGPGQAGDFHPMNPMFPYSMQTNPCQFQQPTPHPQQQFHPCYESPYTYQHNTPRNLYFPQLHSPQNPYAYPPPYVSQSVPCFGTACTAPPQPTFSMPNFPVQSQHQPSNPNQGYASPIVLPPEANETLVRPANSTSLPHIPRKQPPGQVKSATPQSCNSLPTLANKNSSSKSNVNKKEESIIVEESSSEDESKLPKKCETKILKKASQSHLKISLPPISTRPKNISCEEIDSNPKPSKVYLECGPDSNPAKIPCNPRVTHTPVGVIVNPRGDDTKKLKGPSEEFDNSEVNTGCEGGCCSHCKCCKNQITWEDDRRRYEGPLRKHHSPRKKEKLVVSIHECFPSDSSNSDEDEEDVITPRRHSNYPHLGPPDRKDTSVNQNTAPHPGFLPSTVKKRKPTLETILYKPRLRGETEEVFDVLHDLSPDEVRLYSCEYLTELLSSDDWSNCHIGLQTMVRMARHRPKILLTYLGPILWFAFKHLTSAKSALCRAAIVTFKELFQRIGSALDNDLEKLTEKLVLKSLAPNRFIREECYRALEAMVNHCTLIKVLTAMELVSKKPHVRAATHRIARMIKQFVQVAGVDSCLKSLYAEKLLPMLFCFMMEPNNETRVAAKEALAMLMNHLQFEKAVTKHVIFDRNSTEVFKKLDKMRGRNRYRGPIAATKAYNSLAQFKRPVPKTSSFFQ